MTNAKDFWAHQKFVIAIYFSDNVSEIVKVNHKTIPMSDVDSVLVNKLSQFNSDEINKVTRDIMHAYKTSAKLK